MRVQGEVLADIRRAIVSGFDETPGDVKLAVDEAEIGKSWNRITYNIQGLDACVEAVVKYAAQQNQLTRLLTTLAGRYNPSLGPRLRDLAGEMKPLADHAAVLGVELQELESIVLGGVEFQEAGLWIERLGVIRRAICRVEPQPEIQSIQGFGTGFLVEPNVVMTCHHVADAFWSDPGARERVVFRFDYERLPDGSIAAGEEYRLADNWQVLDSPVPDFALMRVRPSQGNSAGRQPIRLSNQAVKVNWPLLVLQHPGGGPLKLLFGEVETVNHSQLRYKINTAGGSSGSPCLASDLRAVGVHYAAGNRAYTVGAICGRMKNELSGTHLSADNRVLLEQLVKEVLGGQESASRHGPTHSPFEAAEVRSPPLSPDRLAELTAHARRSIAAAAQAWLDEQCAPFVVPSLSRQKMERERLGMFPGREEKEWLSEDEIQSLVLGNLPPEANRVRIIGDSGMGKTALLYYCEQRIATADRGRLPLRMDRLSGYDWKQSERPLLETIAERLLHDHLPSGTARAEQLAWLEHLVRQGQVVLLLDALDQTTRRLDQDGLCLFLQCAGVSICPVLMTLRPEVLTSAVFAGASWSSLRAEGFHLEAQRRDFLGDVADVLLPRKDDPADARERKQHWSALLEIPLLLKMLRQLARAERDPRSEVTLGNLHNRHAVYREAVAYLVRQGLRSAEPTDFGGKFYDADDVDDHLMRIGWATVAREEGNFTAVLEGRPFAELRRTYDVDMLRALQQVDIITRHSVLDRYGKAGLAWRHRSFSEYYAAKHLAQSDQSLWIDVARRYARDARWEWVFRFALSELDAERSDVDGHFAQALIQHGNPFVVYDAIDRDGVQLPDHLDRLCRWLVHRDWKWDGRDYRQAWKGKEPPAVDDRWIEIIASLFDRSYRDSRCLHAAWQLVSGRDEAWAVAIRERFLDEFAGLLADTRCAEHTAARDLVAEASFVRCPPNPRDNGKPFQMGSPESDTEAWEDERPRHEVQVSPFRLQRFAVTNRQFELFDPSHRYRRDEYSQEDDQPAIWVSWYMAELFCTWLGDGYRLPTEAEWEYAARAETRTRFWWGDKFDKSKCHNSESGLQHTLPASEIRANPWGLIDMLGNVWEWCQDGMRDYDGTTQRDPVGPQDAAGDRVFRGGSWADVARFCRAALRLACGPAYRYDNLGFRVAAVPPGGAGSKEEE
ncbi:MAG: SUMF1/EgtB/PvdO family nonheme iron enzyme [Pirellulaceae bacterium]|nr:SUMF1/EgtB/PvdO family nonheme iron enzyme [Pirellulaceae bacterium]